MKIKRKLSDWYVPDIDDFMPETSEELHEQEIDRVNREWRGEHYEPGRPVG